MESENPKTQEHGSDGGLFGRRVAEEQILQIFKQLPFVVVAGPLFGAVITALLLFDYVEPVRVYTWVTLVFVSYSSFLFLWAWRRKSDTSSANANKWGKRYLFLSWVTAASWGSVSLFLFPAESLVAQMILAMSVMIGAAAITVATIVYRPVFYCVIFLLAPLFVQFVRVGDEGHYIFALGCVGFAAMLFFINASVSQLVEQSIRLRFSNHQLASDLRVQKDMVEKSSMAKSSFIAVASHDLRQPLHAHGLFLGELRERLGKDAVVGKIVDKLESSLLIVSELFDSLLDISRLDAGVVEPNIQRFFINELMNPIVEQYRVKAEASGLVFRAVLPRYVIKSDKILLGRILRNLLENAVCNTSRGKILIGCRRRSNSLVIQVWDTGCGIQENELHSIFKDYYQIKCQNSRRPGGMGLGLAVVSQLCDLLGHAISVRSVFGKGSVFSVEVPITEPMEVSKHDLSPAAYLAGGVGGMKVLVIDDDESVRLAMSGILSSWKCSVVTGCDAEDVIRKMPSGYIPDVIIADHQLSDGKTGPREIEVLNSRFNRDIDAAVITGDAASRNDERLGASQYPLLQKPVSPAKLCTLLRFIRSRN